MMTLLFLSISQATSILALHKHTHRAVFGSILNTNDVFLAFDSLLYALANPADVQVFTEWSVVLVRAWIANYANTPSPDFRAHQP